MSTLFYMDNYIYISYSFTITNLSTITHLLTIFEKYCKQHGVHGHAYNSGHDK